MKIDNLKGRILKCIVNCTGFQIDEPEAVPIFKDKLIEVVDITDTHIIAKGIPFYSEFTVNKKRLNESFVISGTGEKINY
ncbi:hypothetical protein [Clostridium beijerinckii]|uniref:hypothetical protein n=1 Tax=Clostridium beijerinckii TaxID=1520 RepID=UPI001F1A4B24|nr:hypothetical protein [Clostridium beijerinckii]